MKKLRYSKTFWLAILQGVAGVLAVIVTENPELDYVGLIAIIKSLIDVSLRIHTEQPIA